MKKKGLFSIGEMANAYSELNDPIDQRERFKAQEALLALGDDCIHNKIRQSEPSVEDPHRQIRLHSNRNESKMSVVNRLTPLWQIYQRGVFLFSYKFR